METMLGIMQNAIALLTGGLVGLARGIGEGIVALVKNIFFEINATTGAVTGLNEFGMIIFLFAGISLAIALSTRIYMMLSSLGNRR